MSKASGARRGHESSVPGDDPDHPPELTHRTAGNRRSNVAVDLGWLASLAQEFNVVPEGVHDNLDGDNDDEASGKGEWPTVDGKEDPGEGRRGEYSTTGDRSLHAEARDPRQFKPAYESVAQVVKRFNHVRKGGCCTSSAMRYDHQH